MCYKGRRTNKTITEEVGVAHIVWDTEMWGRKCRAHVEGVEDSMFLNGVIRDVEGSKGQLWDQRRDFKVFFRTKPLSREEEEGKKYGGRAF